MVFIYKHTNPPLATQGSMGLVAQRGKSHAPVSGESPHLAKPLDLVNSSCKFVHSHELSCTTPWKTVGVINFIIRGPIL